MAGTNDNLKAFQGAMGFGANADGGRGGKVLKVTTLEDSGTGSLRWALEDQSGPRIVVFEVGGTIKLKDQIQINGDVTLAGQTAPGGVTVTGGRLRVVESDVIIRGMHVRPGEGEGQNPGDRDGISVGKRGSTVEDVMIDSNSVSWSVDESAATWGGPSKVTFSNNIFAEALRNSIHPEGQHSMGLLVGDGSSQVSVIANLFAHNMYRNATIKDDAKQIEFINNVVYNYGPNGLMTHDSTTVHIIGNVYMPGTDSANREAIQLRSPEPGAAYYLEDNIAEAAGAALSKVTTQKIFTPSNVTVLPSGQVVDHVLSHAGVRAPDLDSVDARIVKSVQQGTGRIIDSPDDVGGQPSSAGKQPLVDTDNDGIPDFYEAVIGSNKNVADAHGDADGTGYDNIETYINGLLSGFAAPTSVTAAPPAPTQAPTQAPATIDSTVPEKVDPISYVNGVTRFEVEDFRLSSGIDIEIKNVASANAMTLVTGSGLKKAEMTFGGPSGTYDITLHYFDENDGELDLSVYLAGAKIDQWRWNEKLAGDAASNATKAHHVMAGVEVSEGDILQLVGQRHKGELMRMDAIDFVKVGAAAPVTEPANVAGPDTALLSSIRIEAEHFEFVSGFRADNNAHASGGKLIRADGDGPHQARTIFDGPSGIYDIAVDYFDENDGNASLKVIVDGTVADSWIWDRDLGNKLVAPETATSRVIRDVRLETGDAIMLVGIEDGGEPLRIDAVEFFADAIFG